MHSPKYWGEYVVIEPSRKGSMYISLSKIGIVSLSVTVSVTVIGSKSLGYFAITLKDLWQKIFEVIR